MVDIMSFSILAQLNYVQLFWLLGGILFILLCYQIYRQRRIGRQLSRELAEIDKVMQHNVEYEFILKAMRLASWHVDSRMRTLTFDNDFREGKGNYTPEAETNIDDWVEHLLPSDRQNVKKALDDICLGQTDVFHQQYQVLSTIPGRTYWEESYATIGERNEDGIPSKIVGASMRIDLQKEMETDLILARNRAEESDRLKTAFLANMGHEIRTPLNAIIGFADLLPVVQDEADRLQLITEIQNNNQKLLRIINGLVSMSEIEAGAQTISMTAVDLNELIQQLVVTYQANTNVEIRSELPQEKMLIHTDRTILTEILDHLMQNAVKFTLEGTITVGYEVASDQYRIFVRDTGKGIAREDQQRIYERFVKLDEYIPGTGLGLSVVKSHVSHLGGTTGVQSELGQGSEFWVQLPFN